MVIGTIFFVAFVVATGTAIVYEWHHDCLVWPLPERMD